MLDSDADRLIVHMKALWDRWDPTDEQLLLWRQLLARYEYEVAREAIAETRMDVRWKDPVFKVFRGKAAVIAGNLYGAKRDSGGAQTVGAYIQCVEAPAHSPGLLGHFYPLVYPGNRKLPPPQTIADNGDAMAQAHADLYGGTWERVSNKTDSEMAVDRAALRDSA